MQFRRSMKTPFVVVLLAVAGLDCAHVNATDMTAAEHRNEAVLLQAKAREDRSEYAPGEQRQMPMPMAHIATVPEERITTYNPSDANLARADAAMREAAAHLAAARKLDAFEAKACRGLSVAERSSCPLLASSVSQVNHTSSGFQLVMKPGVDVAKTNEMLTCHLAYAEKTGFDRPSCPLFVKGSSIVRAGENVIEFKGSSDKVATELQSQAQRVFRGSASSVGTL